MDRSPQGYRVAIFGAGAIGQALHNELGKTVPLVRRGQSVPAGVNCALICWPAHALSGFDSAFSVRGLRVTFCNGVWVPPGFVQGIAYLRARLLDGALVTNAPKWRVPCKSLAKWLRQRGAFVTASKNALTHKCALWGKALYLLPLAHACQLSGRPARESVGNADWTECYELLLKLAVRDVGEAGMGPQLDRVRYLNARLPSEWVPSPSADELDLFRGKIGLSRGVPRADGADAGGN